MQAAICEVQTLALVLAGARIGASGGIPYAPQCSKSGAKEKYETGGRRLPYCTLLHASCVSASSLTPPVLLMHQALEARRRVAQRRRGIDVLRPEVAHHHVLL